MIVKGRARSGAAQLAAYLLRDDGKERPVLVELWDGGEDLHKAFVQWDAIGEATRGEKTLYHAQIAPEARYEMTPEQWKRAAEILAEELGMGDHPRAIVVHEGGKNPHAHVVFQRTDADTMTLWDDGYNYLKHEKASARMEREFAHEHVAGKHAKRDRQKQPELPKQEATQADHQQAARTELTVDERKAQVTALRAASDNAQSFKNALQDAGYILAKGDKRGLVIVDEQGEVYSLSKQVTDLKGKDFKTFMEGMDPDKLPSVDAAKAVQAKLAEQAKAAPAPEPQKQGVEASKFAGPETAPKVEQPTPAPARAAPEPIKPDEKIAALEKAIADRLAEDLRKYRELHEHQLRQKDYELDRELKQKLGNFDGIQNRQRQLHAERLADAGKGIAGFLHALKLRLNPTLAAEEAKARRDQSALLERRLEQERKDYLKLLEQTRQQDLDNTKERQAQQLRDTATKSAEDRDRYIREYRDAERIKEALRERQQQEARERDRGLDPPRVR